jgi:acetyltransferase-like isoleucine patch superfamily enzyme
MNLNQRSPIISFIVAALDFNDSIGNTIQHLVGLRHSFSTGELEIVLVCKHGYTKFRDVFGTQIFLHCDPGGIADAWNIGITESQGKIVNFVGDGDYPSYEAIREVLDKFKVNDNLLYNCNGIFFRNGEIVRRLKASQVAKLSITGVSVHTPCLFIPKKFIIDFKFDSLLKIAVDIDLIFHLSGVSIAIINHSVCIEDDGVSVTSRNKAFSEYLEILNKHKIIELKNPKVIKFMYLLYRSIKDLIYPRARILLRQAKHFLIFILNACVNVVPGGSVRKLLLRFLGIKIGNKSSIRSFIRFYGVGNVVIGDDSVINRGCIIDNRGLVVIGNNVSIAHEVKIYTAGHKLKSPFFEMFFKPVIIKDYCAIFPGAILNPGVELNRGCVVTPGSVVYGTFPENSIISGNPAVIIGRRNGIYRYSCSYDFRCAQ